MWLTQAVKTEAHRLGFDLVGITTPEPPPHLKVFRDWLEAGRHGAMGYLASDRSRARRADPLQILPDCRSILVLGIHYFPPIQKSSASLQSAGFAGCVAAYAVGDDYHEVLPGRLRALVAFIEQKIGKSVSRRWYTDSGPLLERDLAQRAGLGWIGKNTCLIHPRHGSYFLLAEILLGIELEPDPPFVADRCGSCRRCIEACPTDCILPDRTLDARRCISYLTIEQKEAIPDDLRPQIAPWVFGCDICQQACPWNQRFGGQDGDPSFMPRPGAVEPDLIEALALLPQAFNQRFKLSPLLRSKRRGYLRNVATVLGNVAAGSQNLQVVEALQRSLSADPEPLVRAHAAWALGQIGGDAALGVLSQAGEVESHARVLQEIGRALAAADRL